MQPELPTSYSLFNFLFQSFICHANFSLVVQTFGSQVSPTSCHPSFPSISFFFSQCFLPWLGNKCLSPLLSPSYATSVSHPFFYRQGKVCPNCPRNAIFFLLPQMKAIWKERLQKDLSHGCSTINTSFLVSLTRFS